MNSPHTPPELINNGINGCYGSGGSMNNAMYRNVFVQGVYVPLSGRDKKRSMRRSKGCCLHQGKQFWDL